ncbi:MAG: DNA-directed RNA polymerase subunit delta [Firmicutes bacterium]|nr:DNA-directed RNA polymerase subunit delta [Bacillota bacterium]
MKLKNMKLEELELLSYSDLTYRILKEEKSTMNTPAIFNIICDLLGYSEDDFASKIGDYYTALNNDKRFVMLDSGEWDIRDNHAIDISLEEDDEEELASEEEELEEELEDEDEMEEDNIDMAMDDDLDDEDDDLDDLAVLDEEELEDNE